MASNSCTTASAKRAAGVRRDRNKCVSDVSHNHLVAFSKPRVLIVADGRSFQKLSIVTLAHSCVDRIWSINFGGRIGSDRLGAGLSSPVLPPLTKGRVGARRGARGHRLILKPGVIRCSWVFAGVRSGIGFWDDRPKMVAASCCG